MTDVFREPTQEQISIPTVDRKPNLARRFGHYLFTLNRENREGYDEVHGTLDHISKPMALLALAALTVGIDFSDLAEDDVVPSRVEIVKRMGRTNRDRAHILWSLPKEWVNPFKCKY